MKPRLSYRRMTISSTMCRLLDRELSFARCQSRQLPPQRAMSETGDVCSYVE